MNVSTFISMLRGVNVGGKIIHMAELKSLYESLDLTNVETYVQSGNVVFDCALPDTSKLATLLEAQIKLSFGYAVSVFLRDKKDFLRIIDSNPFIVRRHEHPDNFYITFLYQAPSSLQLGDLKNPNSGSDEFIAGNEEIFLFCPNGYGRTKLSNTFFEKKLKMPATTRNWKTVNALYQMADQR
jgi:uncharacterized protein (DUF1697 family)